MRKNSFHKQERLCSKSTIDKLFSEGESFLCYPVKVVWVKLDEDLFQSPAQVSFTVPKKLFKRAPHRNLLKRRMREAYRMKKHELYDTIELENKKIAFMAIYIAKEILPYDKVENGINKSVRRLIKNIITEKKGIE